jgi:hypothetical protein
VHRYGPVPLLVLLAITGCTSYDWNVKHAYVTPWTHLSRPDHDEIIRLVSNSAQDPIIGITGHKKVNDQSEIDVFTGTADRFTDRSWHGYTLQKKDGKWRITFDGDVSHTVANLILSGEF